LAVWQVLPQVTLCPKPWKVTNTATHPTQTQRITTTLMYRLTRLRSQTWVVLTPVLTVVGMTHPAQVATTAGKNHSSKTSSKAEAGENDEGIIYQ
jgi:hypothetical protein